MNIDSIWAVPIASEHSNFILTNKEKDSLLTLKTEEAPNIGSITEDKRILDLKDFKRVREFFFKKVTEYKDEVWCIKNPLHLLHSWATFQNKEDYHKSHYHPHAIISMTYYPQCESGELRLSKEKHALQENFEFHYSLSDYNRHNAPCWKLPVKTGTIVIFPGWVPHSTVAYSSKSLRICMAANFFIEGKFERDEDELSSLHLKVNS
jgi:uncharacterized protein (TIGR02466 family)|tara:strand:- start:2246 stop:2866 length:621 start_codon:yes stop_codon:yes gene_type:complete